MSEEKRITVFTPTYNRANTLNLGYENLKRQTNNSFIWLIIDDGSTDNTEELVNNWILENLIEIRYYKQQNGGKQRAHNKGVELCDTELFICVDSDDYLTEDAIESFLTAWDNIEKKRRVSGIVALKGKNAGTALGTHMPQGVQASTLQDLYNIYGFRGDTALLFCTDILKKFPYFVAEGEKFIGEGYVYLQIDQHYSLYILDKILCICEYHADGYTANVRKLTKNNPKSYTVYKRQAVIFSKTFKGKFINTTKYLVGCFLSKELYPIKNAPYKWLALLTYIPAKLVYWSRYRKL
jgi:glycosyltransferase involved in cell wall biosynthesis